MALARIGLVGALVAVALPFSLVSVAEGAEVRLERFYFDCTRKQCPPNYGERLVVRGGRGEANRLSVGFGAAGEFQVTDAGPALHAGPGCTLSGEQLVACQTSTPSLAAYVLAGDRGDRVTASVAINVDGGSGHDRLAGSPLADALYGGRGRDVVRGNGGDDALLDGLPRLLTPEEDEGRSLPPLVGPAIPVPAESDVFDGGVGTDTLGYEGRRRGVIADLARTDRHAGAPGEGDSLRGLEAVVGSGGDDRIFGNDVSNVLDGADGDDLLVGRAGDDQLVGGSGSNQARGGAGDDGISPGLNADVLENVQRVRCGPGQDEVGSMFLKDFAEDDCESVVILESFPIRPLLPLTSLEGPPLATMDSPLPCGSAQCSARLFVRLARSPDPRRPGLKGLALGSARGSATFNQRITLTASLSERGSALLRRYRSLIIRIGLSTTGALSATVGSGSYLTRLRAPAP
jgi:Ca2+-binding RTX toxin-like protein